MSYRLLLIDDDLEYVAFMQKALADTSKYSPLIHIQTLPGFNTNSISGSKIDLILLDIRFRGKSGIIKIKKLKETYTQAQLIVFTESEDYTDMIRSFEMGADGYLLKSYDSHEVLNTLDLFHKNGIYISPLMERKIVNSFQHSLKNNTLAKKLSEKDVELLRVLSFGFTYKQSAEEIGITVDGVRSRIKSIYKKLNVRSKIEAVNYYINSIN